MGCGCGGKKTVMAPPSGQAVPLTSATPRTYNVVSEDGAIVASSTNPVLARVEARRVGGTVVPATSEPASVSQA